MTPLLPSRRALGFVLLTTLGLARACVMPVPVGAQDDVIATRLCASEIGAHGDPHECATLVHVIAERASRRGLSWSDHVRAVARRVTGQRPYVGREWIPRIDTERGRPEIFPRNLEWERYRVRFASMRAIAWRALRGIEPSTCPGALDWSAPWCKSCAVRMHAAGWRLMTECEGANAYWSPLARPHRELLACFPR